MSIRDKTAAATDLNIEPFDVPEWNVKLELRQFNVATRSAYLDAVAGYFDEKGNALPGANRRLNPSVLIAGAYDPETGEPAYTEDDRPMLESKAAAVVERIANRILALNKLSPGAVDEGKDGSPTEREAPSGGSDSTSPNDSA